MFVAPHVINNIFYIHDDVSCHHVTPRGEPEPVHHEPEANPQYRLRYNSEGLTDKPNGYRSSMIS